jgi:hypothetical protein
MYFQPIRIIHTPLFYYITIATYQPLSPELFSVYTFYVFIYFIVGEDFIVIH